MAGYYYLISSLPALAADDNPPMTPDEFLEQCAAWLPEDEMAELSRLSLVPTVALPVAAAARAWNDWETCLRNAVARHRSASGQDVDSILRYEFDCYDEIESGVQEAWSQSDPLEREKILYRLRWHFLDDLESGHNFDFQLLVTYKLKLLLLLRRQGFNAAAGRDSFAAAVTRIEQEPAEKTE
ncbi:MAG: DUF2764 family protein [Victivallales bacterium]|nr:DUF2764 family protein [Victivallales bacterium]